MVTSRGILGCDVM